MTSRPSETLLFLDEPADSAIAAAARFFEQRGLHLTHHSEYSISAQGPRQTGTIQVAALPIQLRPEWCRVWVSAIDGADEAAAAAEAYVTTHRSRSRQVAAEVQRLERDVYAESAWPAYEAKLRAGLGSQGLDPAAVEARLAAFKQRWLALGRKAAVAPPETNEPEPA